MEILLVIIGIICLVFGLAGCILPMLPGPPVAYVSLILLHFTSQAEFTVSQLTIWLVLVIIVQLLDYFVPMWGSKYIGGSSWGARGCLLGTIVGLFFMPMGIILGPFSVSSQQRVFEAQRWRTLFSAVQRTAVRRALQRLP